MVTEHDVADAALEWKKADDRNAKEKRFHEFKQLLSAYHHQKLEVQKKAEISAAGLVN